MLVDIKPEQLNQFYQQCNIDSNQQSNFNQFINSYRRKTIREMRRNIIINSDKNNVVFYVVFTYLIIIFIIILLVYLM